MKESRDRGWLDSYNCSTRAHSRAHSRPGFRSSFGASMKWSWNFMVRFALSMLSLDLVNAATKEDLETMFLRLYTGNAVEQHVDVHLVEAETLILRLDIGKPTVLYVHGFSESVNSSSVHVIVNAYLERGRHNVLALDWSVIAGANYVQVATNVESVGTLVAMALNDLVQAGLPSENIHVVGHSMGAHVSAYVGRNVVFSLQRITGLDPAGPLFNLLGRHLTRSDARFVDIIHTDFGFYGIARITGSVDFFPNSGRRIQPGCSMTYSFYSEQDFCSHHRSWIFYAESLTKERAFLAVKCSKPTRKRHSSSPIVMGYATPRDAKGSYCLVTGPSAPYGLGEKGAREL